MTSCRKDNNIIQNSKGFTLVELMIAISILAIGVLAVAAMQIQAVKNNSHSKETSEASNIAKAVLEELRILPFNHPLPFVNADKYLADNTDLPDPNDFQNDSLNNPIRNRVFGAGDALIPANGLAGNPEHTDVTCLSCLPANPVIVDGRRYYVYWNINTINQLSREISVVVAGFSSENGIIWHNIRGIR